MKKVTLQTIADAAGVSASCVTRCINNTGYVSKKKREKILKIMDELHYVPNRQAQCLRCGKSGLLGYIYISTDENILFTKTAMALERQSSERGYGIISVALGNVDYEKIKEALTLMCSHKVDGILFNTGDAISFDSNIENLIKSINIPVVMIERVMDIYEVSKVLVDSEEGSYIAANRLYQEGHTKIAYLGVEQIHKVDQERYVGYLRAMERINPEYAAKHSYFTDSYTIKCGYEKCLEILRNTDSQSRPTAIFVASDILAAGVYQAFSELNVRIPDNISLIGYDDTIAAFMSPPLSTIQLPVDEIAEAALEIIFEKNDKKSSHTGNKTVKIGPKYTERQSVCKCK